MHPVGRRIEDEARDHLVVVDEHRDHRPIGDEFAGRTLTRSIASVKRVCRPQRRDPRRVPGRRDRRARQHVGPRRAALGVACARARAAPGPGSRTASTSSIAASSDGEPARDARRCRRSALPRASNRPPCGPSPLPPAPWRAARARSAVGSTPAVGLARFSCGLGLLRARRACATRRRARRGSGSLQ